MRLPTLILLLPSSLYAQQSITGTILGRVVDPSGAPVPGAEIRVTSSETGLTARAASGTDGTYSVTNLLPGLYEVRAEKTGFASFEAKDVRLTAADTVRVEVQLKIGLVSETVSVADVAPLVQTESPAVATAISTTQMRELPTPVQSIDTMLALAAGVQAGTSTDNSNPPIGGGTHWGSVDFTVNGVSANDPGNSGGAVVQGKGLLMLPPLSSLEELKVGANGLGAKYRNHSNVTLVTKGGGQHFHGELFESNQNSALAANTFLLRGAGRPKPFSNINQFGGNIGGPILKQRAFFFFDFNGYRERIANVVQHNFPSMAMRGGDFSALCRSFDSSGVCATGAGTQLYNPFTGEPFPRNIIPTSMITPQATALLKYLPAPTHAATLGLPNANANYVGVIPAARASNSFSARVDYRVRPADSLFVVFARTEANPWNVAGAAVAAYNNGVNEYTDYNANLTETHVFSARAINEFRVAWSDYATKFGGQNYDFELRSLIPQAPATYVRGLPVITASGYDGLMADRGIAFYTPRFDLQITDNITWVHGTHRVEAGVEETGWRVSSRVPSSTDPTGSFSFNGRWTGNLGWPDRPTSGGNSFADFLLGAASATQTPAVGRFADWVVSRDWAFYIQDTWQKTPRLTLTYGLRYEYQSPWKYPNGMVTTLDLKNSKLVIASDSTMLEMPRGASSALWAAYPFETTAQAGLPKDYLIPDKNDWAPRVGFAWRPFGKTTTVVRGGYGIYYNFQPLFVGSRTDAWNPPWELSITQAFASRLPGRPTTPFLPDLTFANPYPGAGGVSGVSSNPNIYMFEHKFRHALMQEWTLTVEQQFAQNWAARATYVGNHIYHIPYSFGNINIPHVQTPNVPLQAQRPYQPWNNIQATRAAGKQLYEQLQGGLQRRFAAGLEFMASYQFTRSLDNVAQSGGPQRWQFPNLDYGNSDGIRRHWLVMNYVWELPVGHGRHFLNQAHGITDALLGGWRFSGIGQYGTGTPFSVSFSQTGVTKVGWFGGRADRVVDAPLYIREDSHDINKGVQWFNPAAFAPPQPWTWGNSSRNLLFGPGTWNWDVSLAKAFSLREKMSLQFRADAFNLFNHFNLGNPNATIEDTRDGGLPVPNAGKITSGSGNRRMQLALRLRW